LHKLLDQGPAFGKRFVKLTSSFAGTEEPAKYTLKRGGRTNRTSRVYR